MSSFIKQCHQQLNVLLSILTENCVKIRRRKRSRRINWKHPTFAIASIVALILLALYHLGGFQGSELAVFDVLMQQHEDRGIDPRLLVVEITEADINQYRWPLSDEVLAQLLAKLQQAQPRAIGLDLYRHSPQGSGQGELLQKLRAENTIAVFKMGMDQTEGKPLPLAVTPERLGFGDIFLDGDGVVRRNGLFVTCDEGNRLYSFPLRLALTYLAKLGLSPQLSPKHPHRLQLGKVRLNPLSSHSGGYTQIDVRGSQILLDYRSPQTVARRVTVEQVLSGKVQSSWIKDKIAIVGLTDPSFKENRFDTPYSAAKSNPAQMPAVLLHAQMTSQLLDVALGQRSLFWFFPYLVEVFWLWGWSFVGSTLAWQLQPPKSLALALGGALLGLAAMVKGLFAFRVWVPLMGPGIGLGVAAMGVLCYRALDRAIHDSLTGLPNRTLFAKHLEFVLKRARSTPKEQCGAIFLDIDRFKAINGSLGHWAGDRLLREVAQRIEQCLRSGDLVARVGGDEFAILVDRISDVEEVIQIARRIRKQLKPPFYLKGQSVFATASMGIAMSCVGENRDLLRDAHTAMYRAKGLGKTQPELFDPTMEANAIARFQLELDLRASMAHSRVLNAVDRQTRKWLEDENSLLPHSQLGEEFRLDYQPLIDLTTGQISGFEALVRWWHPVRGIVPPEAFIPVSEETGLIIPLGTWILREACTQTYLWQKQFPSSFPLVVSVNLSGKQFSQPGLVQQIAHILEQTQLEAWSLKLEITEGVAIEEVEKIVKVLRQIKALKVQVGLDDFGTGYSSLSYLSRFPTDTLKIDRSFIQGMGETQEDLAIVKTVVMLAHTLGMDAIAEGVETAEQLAQLRAIGCEYAQGYFFSKPLSSQAATELLAAQPQW